MVFGAFLWILMSLIPLPTSPEFVVREIQACCHHFITLRCSDKHSKLAIVQARFVKEGAQESIAATVIDPSAGRLSPSESPDYSTDHRHHPVIPSKHAVSLWDLDIKFAHDFIQDNIRPPIPVNSLPEWHPDHISHLETRRRFMYPKVTLPPKFPFGVNYSSEKVIEMPPYETNFLDKDTIWNQPLFHVVQTDKSESNYLLDESQPTLTTFQSDIKCLSYQTLMSSSSPYSSALPPADHMKSEPQKPSWNFKDLRQYFNRKCSGKSECNVYMLKDMDRDHDMTSVCQLMPEGKIVLKYLCYNTSSHEAYPKCNVDVTPAAEGFLMNPGYPDLYPGDQPCQWRLHVPLQKILLLFFDISLRGQDNSRCKDELMVTDEHDFKLLSTCGDHGSAIAVLSESHNLNITLNPQSRLAYPKRGFLAYFRVIGCVDPDVPSNSYTAYRNSTHAFVICEVGHIFPDTLTRDRWLYCSPLDHKWLGSFPYCHDIRNLAERNSSIDDLIRNNPSVWPVKHRNSSTDLYSELILPICVILGIFSFHGFVLYLIWRQRSRLEEIENQTNQEMERMCGADDSPEEVSIFSFPDSIDEDLLLWDHEEEETDPDRTLTTITLQTDTPTSSAARKGLEHPHQYEELRNGNGHLRYYHNGSVSHSRTNSNGQGSQHLSTNSRPHIGYVNGTLSNSFHGYFRTTAV